MIQLIETRTSMAHAAAGARLAPADVIRVHGRNLLVSFGIQQAEAELAVLDYDPQPGDRVLVVGDEAAGRFVIGVLATASPRPRLKIEANASSGATTLSVEHGDLEVIAPHGAVRIISSAGVETITSGPIHLKSRLEVRLSILDRLGQTLNRIGLSPRAAELKHDQLEIAVDRLRVSANEGVIKADRCSADIRSFTLVARRLNASVGSVMTQVENCYHRVAGLWQLAAERTRMVVKGTSHHMAQRLYSKADDVKVKAEKIHLG